MQEERDGTSGYAQDRRRRPPTDTSDKPAAKGRKHGAGEAGNDSQDRKAAVSPRGVQRDEDGDRRLMQSDRHGETNDSPSDIEDRDARHDGEKEHSSDP